MKQVTVNGTTYNLSQQGDNPPWGEDQSDLLEALVEVSNTVTGTGDILQTSFTVANNVTSLTNVTALSFDPGLVRSAIISYSTNRRTNTTELSEQGTMMIAYNSAEASWELTRTSAGDCGVEFEVTSSGQIQYTSSNLSGTGYTGILKFTAKAFTQ